MSWVVVVFGLAVAAIGGLGAVRPHDLVRLVERFWQHPAGLHFAVGLRLVLGAVLIAAAPECRFPLLVRILGAVSLVSAVTGAVVGRARAQAFVRWWLERPAGFVRGCAGFAAAFGGFLVYAAW